MRHRSSARPSLTAVPAVSSASSTSDGSTISAVATTDRPVNRAERRAAARGRDVTPDAGGPSASRTSGPRSSGPGVQSKPAHTRLDFAARKSG